MRVLSLLCSATGRIAGGKALVRPTEKSRSCTVLIGSSVGYDVIKAPGTPGSLLTVLEPREHAQRRRIWEHAFTLGSLKGYEEILLQRIDKLINALQQCKDEPVDLAVWLKYLA